MLDELFGKLKGIQIEASVGGGNPAGATLSLGNQSAVSGLYLAIALLVGVLAGFVLFGRK